jgi:hypothetical protein
MGCLGMFFRVLVEAVLVRLVHKLITWITRGRV